VTPRIVLNHKVPKTTTTKWSGHQHKNYDDKNNQI